MSGKPRRHPRPRFPTLHFPTLLSLTGRPSWRSFCLFIVQPLLPQRFVLPTAGETHCCSVYGWVCGQQGIHLGLHVVVRRNDVQEILDDAKIEINAECVRRKCYPVARHAIRNHGTDGVLLVPDTGMVAAGIAGQGNDGKPRLECCVRLVAVLFLGICKSGYI